MTYMFMQFLSKIVPRFGTKTINNRKSENYKKYVYFPQVYAIIKLVFVVRSCVKLAANFGGWERIKERKM